MAVIIPNAGDTTSGNKYEALDQAEPDALDFEILSNAYSGVLSGCEVTSNASSTNVAVSAGTIVLDGVPYTVAANGTLALPAAPSDNRFDMVVARVTAGTAALTVVSGDDSGTNPSFPRSTSVISGAGSPTSNIFPSTDVVLAAIYRSGSQSVTASRIVDKRAIRNAGIMFQGTVAPTVADGVGQGQFYFDTSAQDGISSGAYIKKSDGSWVGLAADFGAHFPIGGVFAWPADAPTPEGCLEASGQSVATASYPALFNVYGYQFGGSGSTFNMPQLNDSRYLLGTSNNGLLGNSVGENSTNITTSQLPSHRHTHNHTHTLTHTHSIAHNHGSASTGDAGSHRHTPVSSVGNFVGVHYGSSYTMWRLGTTNSGPANGFSTLSVPNGSSSGFVWGVYPYGRYTEYAGTHSHSFNMPNYTGNSGGASNTTTSSPSNTYTGYEGGGDSFNKQPLSRYVKWMVRASLGPDPSYSGGTPAFEAAYEEVFVVELYAEGESVAADTSLGTSFRMPWPGTITNLRAATGVASDTGPIIIDVNEAGGSLLSTKLTIDQGELSSTTAATPAVISDTVLADDALIEFDVDNGGANAEGPLTVTLYITRSS